MRRFAEVLWKTLAVAAVTVVVTASLKGVVRSADPVLEQSGHTGLIPIVLLTEIVFAAVLVYPVVRSVLSGWRLFGAVLLAVLGLNVVLTQVEAAIFLTMSTEDVMDTLLSETVHAVLVAGLVVLAFRRDGGRGAAERLAHTPWSAGRWARRLALCAACYVVLYFGAGMLIWPFIRDFYDTQQISAFAQSPWLLPFQLLRGTLYVLFLLPLLRSLRIGRRQAALAMAALVPVLAGAVGLLTPNPYMPEHVRLLHMVEVGWSNCAYGMLIGWLFWSPHRTVATNGAAAEAAIAA